MRPRFDTEDDIPYYDNAVSTPLRPEALDAMLPFLQERSYGYPGQSHYIGRNLASSLADRRKRMAHILGAEPENIRFVSSGTEANRQVIQAGVSPPACSEVEHESVVQPVKKLNGHILPVHPTGKVDKESLEGFVDNEQPGIVSVQYGNQDTGVIQDIASISEICHRLGVPFHVDVAMGFGIEDATLEATGADILTLSSHKIWGPPGIGVIAMSEKFDIEFSQEEHINMPAIAGMVAAAELLENNKDEWNRVKQFRDELETELSDVINVDIPGKDVARLPNASMLAFKGSDASFIAAEVERQYEACIGCVQESSTAEHVLKSMRYDAETRNGAVRLRFGIDFNSSDKDFLTVALSNALRENAGKNI